MSKEAQVEKMTDIMARFVGYTAKVLPDDVAAKLKELAEQETVPIAKLLYETYARNQKLAKELKPSVLSGYRCAAIFCEMRHQLPADR